MEKMPKSPVTLRRRIERGVVLPAGLPVRLLFKFCNWFYLRISQLLFPGRFRSLRGTDSDVDGVPTCVDIYLAVPALEIEDRKPGIADKCTKRVIYPWWKVAVLFVDVIQRVIVHSREIYLSHVSF
ncbi:hypothetical protein TNCV_3980981 [Trichonephila clavipes]|nr:hypothetical protein TNCV_3980981 [Trichonephila clavipes]